jgi:hypothetical protein
MREVVGDKIMNTKTAILLLLCVLAVSVPGKADAQIIVERLALGGLPAGPTSTVTVSVPYNPRMHVGRPPVAPYITDVGVGYLYRYPDWSVESRQASQRRPGAISAPQPQEVYFIKRTEDNSSCVPKSEKR